MEHQTVTFDPELFTRAASLFVLKRKALPSEVVEALAGDVLRRLATGTERGRSGQIPLISDENIATFCTALVASSPEPALRFIEARRKEGLTRMGIYLGYVCTAARRLGESWERDELSFVDVTTGTGHLYALMRALRAEQPVQTGAFDARRYALFATVPGEKHGIGITVAADVFRERGWEIDLQIGSDHASLVAQVERTDPRIIGLSLSTEARLDSLARLVVALRLVVPQAVIGVACGDGLDGQKVRDLVDIDLIFDGAVAACADLERLIEMHD